MRNVLIGLLASVSLLWGIGTAHSQSRGMMGKEYCPQGMCNRLGENGGRVQRGIENCKPCGKQSSQDANSKKTTPR
jgi:hypothetical protein